MKKLLLALITVSQLLTLQARADFFDVIGGIIDATHGRPVRPGRPDYPGHGGYGRVECTYVDDGWEEHFGGHRSCGECLSKHGNCVETCYTQELTCRAVGYDQRGYEQTFFVYAQDQWEAERRADDDCYYRGLNNCRIQNCDSHQSKVSERMCR